MTITQTYCLYDHDHPRKSDSMTNHLENFDPKNFLARKAHKIQLYLCHEMDIKEHKNSAKAQEQSCKVVNYMRLLKISFGGYPFAFVMPWELKN